MRKDEKRRTNLGHRNDRMFKRFEDEGKPEGYLYHFFTIVLKMLFRFMIRFLRSRRPLFHPCY